MDKNSEQLLEDNEIPNDMIDNQTNENKESKDSNSSLKSKKTILSDGYLRSKRISVWMPFADTRLKMENTRIIDILEPLQIINIYDNIDIIDNLFNRKTSSNCFTIRNDCYQKVFYVGSAQNRKVGKCHAFTLRILDQYSRHVLSIKKYFNCCQALHRVDIVFTDTNYLAKLLQIRQKDKTIEFIITDPKSKCIKFSIKRLSNSQIKHKFDVFANDSIVGYIVKIFADIPSNHLSDNNYIQICISKAIDSEDKALILSAALILNILFFRQIQR